MSAKGFASFPASANSLTQRAIKNCQRRNPEGLDQIFDNLAEGHVTLMEGIVHELESDIETLAWYLAYMAFEINNSEDNNKPIGPIQAVALYFATEHHWRLFFDLLPLQGKCVLSPDKFKTLPLEAQARLRSAFELVEDTPGQAEAQASEWLIQPKQRS